MIYANLINFNDDLSTKLSTYQRTIITITEPHATTSNSLRKAFNDMAQTFKPTLKRATHTFLKSASLSRKVIFKENLTRKNKSTDQRGPKVAWVPKILP